MARCLRGTKGARSAAGRAARRSRARPGHVLARSPDVVRDGNQPSSRIVPTWRPRKPLPASSRALTSEQSRGRNNRRSASTTRRRTPRVAVQQPIAAPDCRRSMTRRVGTFGRGIRTPAPAADRAFGRVNRNSGQSRCDAPEPPFGARPSPETPGTPCGREHGLSALPSRAQRLRAARSVALFWGT